MRKLERLFYKLTENRPRKLPESEAEFMALRRILLEAYDMPDEPSAWHAVSGAIQSTNGILMKKPYAQIANMGKRTRVNALAESYKRKAVEDLEKRLVDLTQAEAEKKAAEEVKDSLGKIEGASIA